jgi:hypothetical protein
LLAALAAAGRKVPPAATAAVGAIALVWGLRVLSRIYGRVSLGELVQEWEMMDARVEMAREAGGLLLVAAWMTVLAIRAVRRTPVVH